MIFKIIARLCIYALVMCLTSCSSSKILSQSHLEKVHRQIGETYIKHLQKTKNLEPFDIYGSFAAEEQSLGLMCISHDKVDIASARILLIEVAEGLIKVINENENIRPFLHSYPFTNKNVEIFINFWDEDNHFHCNGYVAMIGYANGRIFYLADFCRDEPLGEIHEETYEEALRSVQETYERKIQLDFYKNTSTIYPRS